MADVNMDGLVVKKLDQENSDVFQEIQKKLDQIELKDKLKKTFFGGYSKNSVAAVVDGYKKMITWMQDTYDYQLKELEKEKEKIFGERAILKRQLNEELEKKRDYEAKEKRIKELQNQLEILENKEVLLKKEQKRLSEEHQRLAAEGHKNGEKDAVILAQESRIVEIEQAYSLLKQQHDELESGMSKVEAEGSSNVATSGTIRELSLQLENVTIYCDGLEKERASLEKQLSSIKTIHGELERMSQEFDLQKDELKDYQKKYLSTKMENSSLCNEMESTSQVLEEILMQLEEKEAERESMKLELESERQRVMKALREKLDLQNQNVQLTEQLYKLQEEINDKKNELGRVQVDQEKNKERKDKVVHVESSKTGELIRRTEDEEKAREVINQAKLIGQRTVDRAEEPMKEVK